MLLEGRVGIVSGIGPGLGRSIALAFAREGADVALAARREGPLLDVAREVEALGRRAICVPTDIADAAQCRALVAATHDAFGRLDVLVNNAHLVGPSAPLIESDLDMWRPAMEVNYWGSLALTQAAVPHLRASGDGRVIMINTDAVRVSSSGFGPYTGSKTALLGIVRVLAKELGPMGIRVNSVVPSTTIPSATGEPTAGLVHSAAEQAEARGITPEEVLEELAASRALGYLP